MLSSCIICYYVLSKLRQELGPIVLAQRLTKYGFAVGTPWFSTWIRHVSPWFSPWFWLSIESRMRGPISGFIPVSSLGARRRGRPRMWRKTFRVGCPDGRQGGCCRRRQSPWGESEPWTTREWPLKARGATLWGTSSIWMGPAREPVAESPPPRPVKIFTIVRTCCSLLVVTEFITAENLHIHTQAHINSMLNVASE